MKIVLSSPTLGIFVGSFGVDSMNEIILQTAISDIQAEASDFAQF